MPRYINPAPPKPPELIEAERAAQEALRRYFRRELGMQALMARETGIQAPALSRMAKKGDTITLEHALRIEVATDGELRAEQLCPSRCELLSQFLQLRTTANSA